MKLKSSLIDSRTGVYPVTISVDPPPVSPHSSRRPHPKKAGSESSGDYGRVVLTLSPQWRIIECRQGIQWIIQKCKGMRYGTTRWDSCHYLTSRDGLITVCHRLKLPLDPKTFCRINSLPEYLSLSKKVP